MKTFLQIRRPNTAAATLQIMVDIFVFCPIVICPQQSPLPAPQTVPSPQSPVPTCQEQNKTRTLLCSIIKVMRLTYNHMHNTDRSEERCLHHRMEYNIRTPHTSLPLHTLPCNTSILIRQSKRDSNSRPLTKRSFLQTNRVRNTCTDTRHHTPNTLSPGINSTLQRTQSWLPALHWFHSFIAPCPPSLQRSPVPTRFMEKKIKK